MDIWQILMTPFSWLLKLFCEVFDSYGIALLLFTVVVKVIHPPQGQRPALQGPVDLHRLQGIGGAGGDHQGGLRCGAQPGAPPPAGDLPPPRGPGVGWAGRGGGGPGPGVLGRFCVVTLALGAPPRLPSDSGRLCFRAAAIRLFAIRRYAAKWPTAVKSWPAAAPRAASA